MKFSVILLCLLAGIGGCSSKESPADPYATVAMFCAAWGKAACGPNTVTACAGTDQPTDALTQACIASQQTFCIDLMSTTTGYDSQNAGSCLSAVERAYSDGKLTAVEIATVLHRGDPCNHLLKGPDAKGDACSSNDDCNTLENYLCVMKGDAGTCQIPTAVDNGTSCAAPDAACNTGFYCGGDVGDQNCVKSKAVGAKCAQSFECATSLVCDSTALKCVARMSAESCTVDQDCATNVCDIPVGSTVGMCVSTIILAPSEGICKALR